MLPPDPRCVVQLNAALQGETRGSRDEDDDDDDEEQREEAEAAASWQRYLDATRERDAFAEGFVCGASVIANC